MLISFLYSNLTEIPEDIKKLQTHRTKNTREKTDLQTLVFGILHTKCLGHHPIPCWKDGNPTSCT